MVYKFLLLSDEAANFKREILINSQASFLDFHLAILKTIDYDADQLYSFFICGDDWSKQTEITMIEMDTSSEEDSYIMEDTLLEDFVTEEKQKLLYVFDPLSERVFFIELMGMLTKKDLKEPLCTLSVGNPPRQFTDFDAASLKFFSDLDDDENDDDDQDYLDEEIDDFGIGSFDDLPSDERI